MTDNEVASSTTVDSDAASSSSAEITITDSDLQPGGYVDVVYPKAPGRAGFYWLSLVGQKKYLITANAPGSFQRVTDGEEGLSVLDYEHGGPGPDRIHLPDDMGPGSWSICNYDSSTPCVEFELE